MLAVRSCMVAGARRAAPALSRRAFSATAFARAHENKDVSPADFKTSLNLDQATGPNALFGPGGKPDEIPTDFEQATGIERLELLSSLDGIDLFDSQPLVQDRKGTPEDPYIVDSYDRVRYVGCTGFPAGSQEVNWLKVEEGKLARDWESGCCYTLNYLGPQEDAHH